MSLISLKNLVGPLGNKVQIGALIIVIIMVLVIRLNSDGNGGTGAGVKSASSGQGQLLSVLNDARSSRRAKAERTRDEFLDGLVADGLNEEIPPTAKPKDSESFDDIRKSLGLD
jgi:hypothetical protein